VYTLEYPWLLALAPLPLLVWWLLPPYRETQASVRLPFFRKVAKAAGVTPSPGAVVLKTNWLQRVLAPIGWGLLLLSLARPQYVEPPIQKIQSGRDLLLALDISQSMESRDFPDPSGEKIPRVDAVKKVVDGFIQRRQGDRIGLIVFGGAAYPQVPLTLDHETCRILLQQTEVGMAGPRTVIGDAVGLAIQQFEHSKVKDRVLILLTDGNDTGSRMPPLKAAEIAKQKGIVIHTVGIGDPNAKGEDKVDFGTLQDMAAATGGRFFRGDDERQLEQVYATLDRITPQNFKTLTYRPKRPLFMVPLGAAVLLLLAFYAAMFGWLALRRLFGRDEAAQPAAAPGTGP
jgi:Ca-activated chloride channel family protein